jgi:SAM-dependent methyltransferase
MNNIDLYLSGEKLFGDDFNSEQISAWFDDEKEGFANLGAKDVDPTGYGYHALNKFFGFRHLPNRSFPHVLGFGSAYGEELLPVLERAETVTVVEPSNALVRDNINGKPLKYVKPSPDGSLPFQDNSIDLITCFGVLHHIPNVSTVVKELCRILKPEGYILLRETIVSMGDWRQPRVGLTKRERGIPLHILEKIAKDNNMEIVKCSLCDFPVTERIFQKFDLFNTYFYQLVDSLLSKAFAWNLNYHPANTLQRFRPRCAFLVLKKIS